MLKWAGGKRQLLPHIIPEILHLFASKRMEGYCEPFLGGGAVFFELFNTFPKPHDYEYLLSDVNWELMNVYQQLVIDPNNIISRLRAYERQHSRDNYYQVRGARANDLKAKTSLGAIERRWAAARFIYLNRTCFNGLYRVNRAGLFNVPFGDYKNPTICDEPLLRAVAAGLQEVNLVCEDFEKSIGRCGKGVLVYADPPYVPLNATSNFTGYSVGGFTLDDQRRLHAALMKHYGAGGDFILSNSDTPFVRELYAGFQIKELEATRRINSKGDKRGPVSELLILGRARTE